MPKPAPSLPVGIYRNAASPYLWGRVQIDGREYRKSLRTADPKEASRRREAWREGLEQARQGGQETWQEAVVRWDREVLSTCRRPAVRRRYLSSIAQLDELFGELRLSQVDRRKIADYVGSRSGLVSNATIRRDLTALSRLMAACASWGWIDHNPVALYDRSMIAEPERVFRPPSAEEFATLLTYAPAGMAAILRFLDQTGARLNEAVTLTRDAIDWGACRITFRETKTVPRAIAFATPGGDATPGLRAAVPHLKSPYVFRSRDNDAYVQLSTGFGQTMGRCMFHEAKAGRTYRRWRIHDLRHGFAIRWLTNGGSVYALKSHLGHSTVSTTEIYLRYLTHEEQERAKVGTVAGTVAQRPAQNSARKRGAKP